MPIAESSAAHDDAASRPAELRSASAAIAIRASVRTLLAASNTLNRRTRSMPTRRFRASRKKRPAGARATTNQMRAAGRPGGKPALVASTAATIARPPPARIEIHELAVAPARKRSRSQPALERWQQRAVACHQIRVARMQPQVRELDDHGRERDDDEVLATAGRPESARGHDAGEDSGGELHEPYENGHRDRAGHVRSLISRTSDSQVSESRPAGAIPNARSRSGPWRVRRRQRPGARVP